MNRYQHINATRIQHLMRKYRRTIRGLSLSMGVSMGLVRFVRTNGVRGYMLVCDWYEAITGVCIYRAKATA